MVRHPFVAVQEGIPTVPGRAWDFHSAQLKLGLYKSANTRLNHVGKSKAELPKKGHHL